MRRLTLEESIELLLCGRLLAIPTETVYGLAANAHDDSAVRHVFSVKGRPSKHPLIVHIHSFSELSYWAHCDHSYVEKLCRAYWPGPLTVVLRKTDMVSDVIVAGSEKVAVRVPRHSLTQDLLLSLKKEGCFGVVAPSANCFGHVSPTMPEHVFDDLGHSISGVLDGGFCPCGLESTILDCTESIPRVLRKGRVPVSALSEFLKMDLEEHSLPFEAPGTLSHHYSPNIPLFLSTAQNLIENLFSLKEKGPVGVLSWSVLMPTCLEDVYWTRMPKSSFSYACRLYERLRFLEKRSSSILVEVPPSDLCWEDIHDRLQKSSQGYFSLSS